MNEIIPAILPKNYEELKNKIALVRGVALVVQVDICDGIFVKSVTWPFPDDQHFSAILNEEEGMPFWEEFDEKCLEHIKTLKEKFPDLIISVDGGVNFETAEEILDAGADRLVIGSAIFNTDDIIGTIENFRQI